MNLEPEVREELRSISLNRLPIQDDGLIPIKIRAWGIQGMKP